MHDSLACQLRHLRIGVKQVYLGTAHGHVTFVYGARMRRAVRARAVPMQHAQRMCQSIYRTSLPRRDGHIIQGLT